MKRTGSVQDIYAQDDADPDIDDFVAARLPRPEDFITNASLRNPKSGKQTN